MKAEIKVELTTFVWKGSVIDWKRCKCVNCNSCNGHYYDSHFFKEFKIITFDRAFAQGIGIPVSLLNGVLMFLIVSVVVIGLQAVGVVLMSALLITPALAARYWTEKLEWMTLLAGGFGALSGVAGAYISLIAYAPTGPLVIILRRCCLFFIFICSETWFM